MMGLMELNPTVSWGRSVRSQSYCPCCVHTLYVRFDFLGSGIYGLSLDIHVPPPGTCRLLLLCIGIRGFVLSSWISLQKAPEIPLIIILISINLLKILFPYVCRSFAWKLAATFLQCSVVSILPRVRIQNIILKSAPLKAEPFIVLLPEHNFNLFESTRAYFRGEVKYIKDNGFSHSLNWTMVWVSFLIGLDFQSIKGKVWLHFTAGHQAKICFIGTMTVVFFHLPMSLEDTYSMLSSRSIPGSAPFSQPHQSTLYTTDPEGGHSGALAEVHLSISFQHKPWILQTAGWFLH